MTETSGLARFRAGAASPKPVAPKPRLLDRLSDGYVLAIDQSLSASGWAIIQVEKGSIYVATASSLLLPMEPKGGLPPLPKGHEGNLVRAVAVHQHLVNVMGLWKRERADLVVVHEHPPVGSRMIRPESSLLAAAAVRIAAAEHDLPVSMVDNQHSKVTLVGTRTATKSEWHKGLAQFPIQGAKATNEGQRDALCLGLTHLIDKEDDR